MQQYTEKSFLYFLSVQHRRCQFTILLSSSALALFFWSMFLKLFKLYLIETVMFRLSGSNIFCDRTWLMLVVELGRALCKMSLAEMIT